jgi:hypothetical protein
MSNCTISQGELNGWKTLTLENDLLRVTILPEKGSDILEFIYKPLQLDYLWKRPTGLPQKPNADRLPHDQFMDWYEGGWQEIFPSGGEASSHAGVDYGLHGESWSLPWEVKVENAGPDEVSVLLTTRLTILPLSAQKRLTLRQGESILHIEETITNESDEAVDFMWGHHPALGGAFMNGDCVLDVPASELECGSIPGDPAARLERDTWHKWPIAKDKNGNDVDMRLILPETAEKSDEFWLVGLKEGWLAVTDTKKKVGFGLVWNLEVFRSLWIWQEFRGAKEAPWNGEAYVMGIEPWSSYALLGLGKAVERNTHLTMPPRGKLDTWMKAIAYEGLERVQGITPHGAVR